MRVRCLRWTWGLLAAAALLWPDRIASAFDGAPLDQVGEALLVGGVFPALCWFFPEFLSTRRARVLILALLAWRAASTALFVQDGWCVQFVPARPFAKDAGQIPHAWDFRADWRSYNPACSAVMTRSYRAFEDFPAWFFNLPPPNESWPDPADIPPFARTPMHVRGYLTTRVGGTLDFAGAPGVEGGVVLDGRRIQWPVTVGPGTHTVNVDVVLSYNQWALVSKWNGADLWRSGVVATLHRPSRLDIAVRPWIRWIPSALATLTLIMWVIAAARALRSVPIVIWTTAAVAIVTVAVVAADAQWARWVVPALIASVFVRVPPRLRNVAGAYALVGVPWLAFVLVGGIPIVGKFRLYEFGNDYWMYQRFGYRIVMQGYWLEGGSRVFYFQPLYRWTTGLLHVVFGDSSVGERFWDGACLLAGAMVSFRIVRAFAGFRWGLVGAVMPLAVFALGTARYLMGFGLSEISSAGLLHFAVLCALRSRASRTLGPALAAGVLATLGFYTRLNNGIMAFGVALFAVPLSARTSDLLRPSRWFHRVSWQIVAVVWAVIACGLVLFAWRTWHYTGVFSVFYGTQRYIVAIWDPGLSFGGRLDRLFTNLARVLTVNDPGRFDVYALPVIAGAAAATASVAGAPRLRNLPAAAVLFFCSAIAGSFIVYGFAYPGRFSMHLLPITAALTTCALAVVTRTERDSRRSVRPATQPVIHRRDRVVDRDV